MSDPTPAEKAKALGLVVCTSSTALRCWKTPDGATHYSPNQLDAAYAPLALDTDALVQAVVERNDPTAEARRALADAEADQLRSIRPSVKPLTDALRAALVEVDRLRTRLATVELETADARRLGASIHKAAARAVEASERDFMLAIDKMSEGYRLNHGGGGDYCRALGDLREYVALGAHRTDDPLPSAIEAAREEGRRAGIAEERAIDLDEYRDEALTAELARRKGARESGVCDYCGRTPDTATCKVGVERHKWAVQDAAKPVPASPPIPAGFTLMPPGGRMSPACGGRGPDFCPKGNSCIKHNGCVYAGACNRPTWHVTCTDATGETAFAADCVGNIYIERDGVGARATCFPYGGLGPSEFHVELAACSATKEGE